MLKFIFWFLTIYFLYRLVFNFIIPVMRVSRQMKGQVREFQDQMNARNQQASASQPASNQSASSSQPKAREGDYIDFEEIK